MPFLKLLKKRETKLDDSLDIPPPPPPGLETEEAPKAQEAGTSEEEFLPELGRIKERLPQKVVVPVKEELKPLPPLPELKEKIPAAPEHMGGFRIPLFKKEKGEIAPPMPLPQAEEELPELPFLHEEMVEEPRAEDFIRLSPVKTKKAVKPAGPKSKFLVIGAFRDILNDVNEIRVSLKDFEDILGVPPEEREENKLYASLMGNLVDIQKKLRFVDRNLSKG